MKENFFTPFTVSSCSCCEVWRNFLGMLPSKKLTVWPTACKELYDYWRSGMWLQTDNHVAEVRVPLAIFYDLDGKSWVIDNAVF